MNKLITIIVPRNGGESITHAAKTAGANGATILHGRGTAQNQLLQIMGLGDAHKEIIFILCNETKYSYIKKAIVDSIPKHKKNYGILFSTEVNTVVKNNQYLLKGETPTMTETQYELITVILNAGYADEAMAAARKAGASGGTIINGRGTGNSEDETFLGISIVPEKELLLILVEKNKAQEILDSIRLLPCLQNKGSGIVFCSEVTDFINLGDKK